MSCQEECLLLDLSSWEVEPAVIAIPTCCDIRKSRGKCPTSRNIGGGNTICDHYNCAVKFPHLIAEFDIERNGGKKLSDFSPGSSSEVWWKCSKGCCTGDKECHVWEATISNRTGRKSGCPYCDGKKVCKHENLASRFPELVCEFDNKRNKRKMDEFAASSNVEVWWICKIGCPVGGRKCHRWKAQICNRTIGDSKCPYCDGRKVCNHNNVMVTHPSLKSEFDTERNPGVSLENHSYGSSLRVNWICLTGCPVGGRNCHRWPATIADRVCSESGCPFCSGREVCGHSNVVVTHPELMKEFDIERNPGIFLENYSYGSSIDINWICATGCPIGGRECHRWPAPIYRRTCQGSGCPFCNRDFVCEHSNVVATHSELMKEFDTERNPGVDMTKLSYGSKVRIWWLCYKKHSWYTSIGNRIVNGNGCVKCRSSRGEEMIELVLSNLTITYIREYSNFPELPRRRFDFMSNMYGILYMIEYDGIQHFKDIGFFGKNTSLEQRRCIDIIKHLVALKYNFRMIRIDYTVDMTDEIFQQHIQAAIAANLPSYYSTPSLYSHIIDAEKEYFTKRIDFTEDQQISFIQRLANKYSQIDEILLLDI